MDTIKEQTCQCIKALKRDQYQFHTNREYQVDIYPLFYKVYLNGGWTDYIFIENTEEFEQYFKIIK